MAANKQSDEPVSDRDGSTVRIVRIVIWPVVVLILGLFALWYYHTTTTSLAEISVAKVMTIKFNLLAAENDRLSSAGARDGASASAPSTPEPVAPTAKVTAVADRAAKLEFKGTRVLWVDDNPQNNTYEQRALSALGIEFDAALSTNEALGKLAKTRYDLIISDFSRRDDPQGGVTLIDDLKKVSNAPPVIIYSSGWSTEREAQLRHRGAFGETNQSLTLFQMVVDALQKKRS